jgi:alpha-methylacyl-CoA racemase
MSTASLRPLPRHASRAPSPKRLRPPSLPGNHTHALLRELGLDADAVAELEDAGVVAQRSSQ